MRYIHIFETAIISTWWLITMKLFCQNLSVFENMQLLLIIHNKAHLSD